MTMQPTNSTSSIVDTQLPNMQQVPGQMQPYVAPSSNFSQSLPPVVSTQQPPHSYSQHVPQNGTNYMYVNDLQQVPPVQSNSMMNPPMMGLVGEEERCECSTASWRRESVTLVYILIVSFDVFVCTSYAMRVKQSILRKPLGPLHTVLHSDEQPNGC